jgi:hypothetical protein
MQAYMKSNPKRMSVITANPKPLDWIGKNWACYQGYLNATGVQPFTSKRRRGYDRSDGVINCIIW